VCKHVATYRVCSKWNEVEVAAASLAHVEWGRNEWGIYPACIILYTEQERLDSAWNHVVLAYPVFKSRTTRKKTSNPTPVKMALAQGSPVNTQVKTIAIDDLRLK